MTHSDRPTIRCPHCELNQFAGKETCRRCRKPLPVEEDRQRHALQWLPDRLRALRNMRGIHQRELAEKIGSFRTYITRLETGKIPHGPNLEAYVRIAAALDLPIAALVEPDDLVAWACVLAHLCGERERLAVLSAAEKMATA